MTEPVSGTIECKNWKEVTFDSLAGGAKLTRATSDNTYTGGIEGTSTVEYLMFYTDAATAYFTGLEHVRGQMGGKSGEFVLRHVGTFRNGQSETELTVLPGSGTGEFCALTGGGKATWNGEHGQASCYSLELEGV